MISAGLVSAPHGLGTGAAMSGDETSFIQWRERNKQERQRDGGSPVLLIGGAAAVLVVIAVVAVLLLH